MADINKFAQFLKGFLEEQDRQKTEKKLQTLMKDKNYDVSWTINPITNERVAQVKPIQQPMPGFVPQSQNIGGTRYVNPQQQGKNAVKVIGNSLVKYDPETGQATPLYTAPAGKKIFKDSMGAVWEYDQTGNKQKIIDEMGNPVEPVEPPSPKSQQPATQQPMAEALPQGVTEEDIQFTMKKHKLTREEVLKRLKK